MRPPSERTTSKNSSVLAEFSSLRPHLVTGAGIDVSVQNAISEREANRQRAKATLAEMGRLQRMAQARKSDSADVLFRLDRMKMAKREADRPIDVGKS